MNILFAIISAIPILDHWFNQLSQLYRSWKFNSDQQAAAEAFQKAQDEQEVEDLQKRIGGGMKMILLLILGYLLAGCQTTQPPQAITPRSLCLLDPQSGFCWISRAKGLGIKLDQMQGFYALSSDDLKNIVTRLNWCQSHPENPEALDAAPTEFTNTLRHIEK